MAVAGAVTVAAACAAAVLSLASPASSDEARGGPAEAGSPSFPAPSHECAVCLSELPAGAQPWVGSQPAVVRALPASGHAFHADCIGRWLLLRSECPLCRRPVLLGAAATAAAGGQQPAAAAAPSWARPATTIACGFGDGRVAWTRSPSASDRQ